MPYEYEIPAVNGKPLVEIPKELKDKVIDYTVLRDKIIIKASDLVDQLLYDTRVKVRDELGRLVKSITEYSYPPTASAIVCKDEDYVYAYRPSNNFKGYILIDKGEAGVEDAKVIQKAITEIPSNGEIFISGNFTINAPLLPRSNIIINFKWSTIKLVDGVRQLFSIDNNNYELKNFRVENIIVIGNRNELTTDSIDNDNNARLFKLFVKSARDITIRNIITENYFGGIGYICAYGSNTIENVLFENIVQYNGGCVTPKIRNNDETQAHRNIMFKNMYLWVDDDTYNILHDYALHNHVIGVVGFNADKIIARKATDGLTLHLFNSDNVEIGTIVGINNHDYVLGLRSCKNVHVGSVWSYRPSYYGVLRIDSERGNVENVTIDNIWLYAENEVYEWGGVHIWSREGYDIKRVKLGNVYIYGTRKAPIRIIPQSGSIDATIDNLEIKNTYDSGLWIESHTEVEGKPNVKVEIKKLVAEDTGLNAPDNDHKAGVYAFGSDTQPISVEIVIEEYTAIKTNIDIMYGVMLNFPSGSPEARVFIERFNGVNVDEDIKLYDPIGGTKRNIISNKVYTSLPKTDIVGDKILYYDGSYYYLAVWDGSTWRKVQLS